MDEENQSASDSILDRVLQSQQTVALEHFDPEEIVTELLKHVTQKESDVLRRRFGLGQESQETLEKIGQQYQVTRERVRQIERWAIKHLQQSSTTKHVLHDLDVLLQQLLEAHGGLLLEDELFQALHTHSTPTAQSRAAISFLLNELMMDKVEPVTQSAYKPFWKLRFHTLEHLPMVIAEAEAVIESSGGPLNRESLIQQLLQRPAIKAHASELNETVLESYLQVATTIERNPFGEYGLRSWGSIVPKRMHDKILLVMRKHGKPMHFHEITQKINELGFDKRKAYPPTVHNELILNDEYVLIGRGIYALREWGYQPGVVADVLEAILKQRGEPMSRDELVKQVMEQRMVKRNTVHLALTNKQKFQRLEDGRYGLSEITKNQPQK